MAAAPAPNPRDAALQALETEWLLTNGLGGYAMGTALGANTRRYHGLLVAATRPPLGRILALHSVIAQIELPEGPIDLSTHQFGEECSLHPGGWRYERRFSLHSPFAAYTFAEVAGLRISRTVVMPSGENAVNLEYRVEGLRVEARLRLRPLTPLRDFHRVELVGERTPAASLADERELLVEREALRLRIRAECGEWRIDPQWWRDFRYVEDRARGQEWREDVWSPAVLEAHLESAQVQSVRLHVRFDSPVGRMSRVAPVVPGASARERLEAAADQFVVQSGEAKQGNVSIVAGYPWFADWGRDTMISLPGLLLVTGRVPEARRCLMHFARCMRNGLVPNRFHDTEPPLYNTVDASLWFIHAVWEFLREREDEDRVDLLAACRNIVQAYRAGTDFGIRVDDDGLVVAGDESVPLTWMDAHRGGVAFTPRAGKAVEISALWHHALHCLAELTDDETEADDLREAAARTRQSFTKSFWWRERECLHDVLVRSRGHWRGDDRLRPNQIFAVSLKHSPLEAKHQRAVVRIVRERLLTPFGLRTLDRDDPDYRGRYEGDLMQRDAAYHNGVVWPWLLGPYCEAVLRADSFSDESKARVRSVIEPLLQELDRGCLNQLAEVYDGDEPQRASGCPAQAWSVAEVLRVLAMLEPATAPVVGTSA